MNKSGRKVVVASRNRDKVRELQQLLEGTPFTVLSAGDFPGLPDVIEDGTTILGNATRKAMVTAAFTGEIALADDTSLQVRELNGWPDTFAARFSGPGATYASNAKLLLELMEPVPDGVRNARFASCCVWIDPRPAPRDIRLKPGAYEVLSPARRRWVRNPWSGTRPFHPHTALTEAEWDYWNTLVDRRAEWAKYTTAMLSDSTSFGGHDRARLRGIAEGLLAGCPDSPLFTGGDEPKNGSAMRLPDPRIWTARGPGEDNPAPGPFHPSGLPADAPGKEHNQELWLELAAEGKLLGEITRQPVGGGGFGYDPVFRPTGSQQTLAEIDPEAKHRISHRGKALRRLLGAVRQAYGL